MQLSVKHTGGPSPGITITGEAADLVEFAERIKAGAGTVAEGPITACGIPAIGNPCDWIQIEVVKKMGPVVRDHEIKTRGIFALVALFYASLPVAAYLIYRGVRSFF